MTLAIDAARPEQVASVAPRCSRASTSRCERAPSSRCSGRTARARPRSSTSSPTLVRPDGGTASVAGCDVVAEAEEVQRSISLTGQSAAVDGVLTGAENLRMMGRLSGRRPTRRRARAAELLDRFDLADAAGKRVVIVLGRNATPSRPRAQPHRALRPCCSSTSPPRAWTRGADWSCGSVIRSLASRARPCFLTTQYLEEADQLADRIAVLDARRRRRGGHARRAQGPHRRRRRRAARRRRRAARSRSRPTAACTGSAPRSTSWIDPRGRRRRRVRLDPSAQPRRRVPRHHRPQRGIREARTPRDEVTTMTTTAPTLVRPRIGAFTAESDLHLPQLHPLGPRRRIGAHGDRAARDAHAHVHVDLRQRHRPVGRLRGLRRARHHPAVRRVRLGLHRRVGRERHDDGHHRPVPDHADPKRGGAHRPRRREPRAQPRRDRGRLPGGVARRVPPDCHAARVGRRVRPRDALESSRSPTCSRRSGSRRPRPRRRTATASSSLFLPYLSSAFVPVETMPDWLQWIAENQPITPIIETLRSLLMGTPMGDSAWWAVGWCVVIIAGSVIWAAWLFRRKAGRR